MHLVFICWLLKKKKTVQSHKSPWSCILQRDWASIKRIWVIQNFWTLKAKAMTVLWMTICFCWKVFCVSITLWNVLHSTRLWLWYSRSNSLNRDRVAFMSKFTGMGISLIWNSGLMKLAQQGVFTKGAAHLPCSGCWGGRAGADWSCWCSDSSGFLWTLMNLRKGENGGEYSLQV